MASVIKAWNLQTSAERANITGTRVGSKTALDVSVSNVLVKEPYDYVGVTYPSATSEVYTFKTGGAGGTTTAVVTLVYTDAGKASLSTVTKT